MTDTPHEPTPHTPESQSSVGAEPSPRPSVTPATPPSPVPSRLDPAGAATWGSRLRRIFLAGLLTLAPAALTIYLLVLVFQLMDGIFAPLVDQALSRLDPGLRIPGLGVVLTLLTIFLLGWLSTNMFGRQLIHWGERLIARIPVAKSIYGATKGVMEALSHEQREAFKRVVLVEYPKANLYALGFVTRSTQWGEIEERLEDILMVFVPTTPNPTSGFLLLVPRDEAVPLPISVEEGIRLVISGGLLLPAMGHGGPEAGQGEASGSGEEVGRMEGKKKG